MARHLEFMDGFDTWKGADILIGDDNRAEEKANYNCPWIRDTSVTIATPAILYAYDASIINYTAMEDMITEGLGNGAGGNALVVKDYGYDMELIAPHTSMDSETNFDSGDTTLTHYSKFCGFHLTIPADIKAQFADGFGGELFSVTMGSGNVDLSRKSEMLTVKYNHVDENVYITTGRRLQGPGGADFTTYENRQRTTVDVTATTDPFYVGGCVAYYDKVYALIKNSNTGLWTVQQRDWKTLAAETSINLWLAGGGGDIESVTRKDAKFYVLQNNAVGEASAQVVRVFDSTWTQESVIDISGHGLTSPIAIDYDYRYDEFYILDSDKTMYVFDATLTTELANSGAPLSTAITPTDMCVYGSPWHQGGDTSTNNTPYNYDSILFINDNLLGDALYFMNKRRAATPFMASQANIIYNYQVSDSTQPYGRAIYHDGFYLWEVFTENDTSLSDVRLRRYNPGMVEHCNTSLTSPVYSNTPITLAPGSSAYIAWNFSPSSLNTSAVNDVWVDGVNKTAEHGYTPVPSYTDFPLGGVTRTALALKSKYTYSGTVAHIDDFYLYTSTEADHDWYGGAEGHVPTRCKIHTRRPYSHRGTVVESDTERTALSIASNEYQQYKTSSDYLYFPLDAVSELAYNITGLDANMAVAAVASVVAYTREEETLNTSVYPTHDYSLKHGVVQKTANRTYDYYTTHNETQVAYGAGDLKGFNLVQSGTADKYNAQKLRQFIYETQPGGADWTLAAVTNYKFVMATYDTTLGELDVW